MTSPQKSRFVGLEVARGLASAMVVFHHAGNMIALPRFYGYYVFNNHLANFNVGVDFFFVLSGFIISWIHWGDIGSPSLFGQYAYKRFLRIYPAYWCVLAPLTAMYFFFPSSGLASQRDSLNLVCSALLIPCNMAPVLGVAWTLVCEVFFYTLFGLLIVLGKKLVPTLFVWALAIIWLQVWGSPLSFPLSFLFSAYNLEFLGGICVALFLRTHKLPLPGLIMTLGISAFIYLTLFQTHIQATPLLGRTAFGFSAALTIIGLVEFERTHGLKMPRALVLLGTASYAIYLVHPILLSLLTNLLFKIKLVDRMSAEMAVFVFATIAILGGILFHVTIENGLRFVLPSFIDRLNKRRAESK